MFKVAMIVGSLRKESFNRKLALALDKLNHSQLQFLFLKIEDVPLYNQDLDEHLPASVARMKKEIAEANAVLIVTPEYNRSIPGVLKNIIDWGTRPYGKNVWAGKPCGIVGISPSNVGTAVSQSHLRSVMTMLDVRLMGLPEVYLVYKDGFFDNEGNIAVENTKKFLQDFLNCFSKWVEKFCK